MQAVIRANPASRGLPPRKIDYVGVVDGDLRVYMIPIEAVDGLGTIVVRRYEAYRIGGS